MNARNAATALSCFFGVAAATLAGGIFRQAFDALAGWL
jgi:hypothetical protein